MTRFRSVLVGLALVVSTSGVFAHAHLKASVPPANASVHTDQKSVTLTFSEAVHTAMSQFKIYPIKDASAAATVFKTAFAAVNDKAARVDSGITPADGSSNQVTVALKQPLKAGTYLVAWKVMAADDGHMSSGHYVFKVQATR